MADVEIAQCHEPAQFQPRGQEQKYYFENRSKAKLSRDSFYNVHELAYALPDFVWSVTTHPDFVVTFGITEFLKLVNECSPAYVTYDTTFHMGDFYVTSLVLQLSMFKEKPIIPLGFMMHERKFQRLHEEFCYHLARKLGKIVCTVVAVTDGEHGCSNALQKTFPAWHVLTCWNHVLRDAEFWLKGSGACHAEVSVYKTQLFEMLSCETDTSVAMTEATYRKTWSRSFEQYYDTFLQPRVHSSHKGVMLKCGLEGENVTTNNSESMNAVMKRFNDWTEVSPEHLLLAMYRLQLSYGLRINKSRQSFGPYVPLQSDITELLILPECVSEEDILPKLPPAGSLENIPDVTIQAATLLTVLHVPQQQVFNVASATGVVQVVRLFPQEHCTCPAGTTCCHVIAVRRSIGQASHQRQPINLSKLRKRSRYSKLATLAKSACHMQQVINHETTL